MNIHHLPVTLMWTCMYIHIYVYILYVYMTCLPLDIMPICAFQGPGKQIKSSQDNMPSTELKPGRSLSIWRSLPRAWMFAGSSARNGMVSIGIDPYTLWLFNVAMENGRFTDDLWWVTYKKWWFPIATLNNQRVSFSALDWTQPLFHLKHLVHQQSWNLKHGKTYWGFQG